MTETRSYKLCLTCGAELFKVDGKHQTICSVCGADLKLAPSVSPGGRLYMMQPEDVKVKRDEAGQMQFYYQWFNSTLFSWIGFGGLVAGLLLVGLTKDLLSLLAGLAGGAVVGIFIARDRNFTVYTFGKHLTVKTRPMPLPIDGTLEMDQIRQFCCRKTVRRTQNDISFAYDLVALLKDGTERVLLFQREEMGAPLYLEQHFERLLRLENERISRSVRQVE